MSTASGSRAQSARRESLKAERIAPGMFRVENRTSGSEYIVDAVSGACECQDYTYRAPSEPDDFRCKHGRLIEQIANGELCDWCGYALCRPSCPKRGVRNE